MTRYWFVLAKIPDWDPPEFPVDWPEHQPVTGSERVLDCSGNEAADLVLNELFIRWYLDSLKPYWTVETMDFETWKVWAFDHEPNLAEYDETEFGDACGVAQWTTPGAVDDMLG